MEDALHGIKSDVSAHSYSLNEIRNDISAHTNSLNEIKTDISAQTNSLNENKQYSTTKFSELRVDVDENFLEANTKLREVRQELKESLAENMKKSGTTYTRWGRTSCPGNGSEVVYSGYAGGSHYSHKGAAASMVCLPKTLIGNRENIATNWKPTLHISMGQNMRIFLADVLACSEEVIKIAMCRVWSAISKAGRHML